MSEASLFQLPLQRLSSCEDQTCAIAEISIICHNLHAHLAKDGDLHVVLHSSYNDKSLRLSFVHPPLLVLRPLCSMLSRQPDN
eukprot:1787826-Amphidinium_carterae.1